MNAGTYSHYIPAYRLVVDGVDITPKINGRLLSLTLTENRGDEADTLNLSLSDHDGQMAMPPHGAVISLALGWEGKPLEEKGTYTVDETEHSGTPDTVTIRARSANLRDQLPGKKSRSWYRVTLAELVEEIAKEHGLIAVVSPQLAGVKLPAPQQTDESDISFLTRLGLPHDAIVTVKEGRLLFIPKAQAATVSGSLLPAISLQRSDGDQHRYSLVERDAYSGVRAKWTSVEGGRYFWVVAGTPDKATDLPDTYADEASALAAAAAEFARIQRGLATMTLTLARGRPELAPETPVVCQGWKEDIDGKDWIASRTVHSLDEGGLTTMVEAEVRQDLITTDSLDVDNSGEFIEE